MTTSTSGPHDIQPTDIEPLIHPELRGIFAELPHQPTLYDVEGIRTLRSMLANSTAALNPPSGLPVTVTDEHIDVPAPERRIRLRIYRPQDDTSTRPGLFWIHGGGLSTGLPEQDENLCIRFVAESGLTVVSVDYRLVPENPYPAGLDDCEAGLEWMFDHADQLHVDPHRIGAGGTSAGGGLVVALALRVRDRGRRSLAFQIPLYPMLDASNTTLSSRQITDDRTWDREKNISSWGMYLAGGAADEDYQAVPARATDLSGLPPTYTSIGELEVFRDETVQFVSRLAQAGVPVEFHLYPGCFHACEMLFPQTRIAQRILADHVEAATRFARP
jgi:acetyl esterase/lipase